MFGALGLILIVVGAVLVPVGWLYDRNWWVIGIAALFAGCLMIMWQRRRQRDRETPDTDIHTYSGVRGGPGYARRDGIDDAHGDDD